MAPWLVYLFFIGKLELKNWRLSPSYLDHFYEQKLIVMLIYVRVSCHQFMSKYKQTPIFEPCQELRDT